MFYLFKSKLLCPIQRVSAVNGVLDLLTFDVFIMLSRLELEHVSFLFWEPEDVLAKQVLEAGGSSA